MVVEDIVGVSEIVDGSSVVRVIGNGSFEGQEGVFKVFLNAICVAEIVQAIWFFRVYLECIFIVRDGLIDFPFHVVAIGKVVFNFIVHIDSRDFLVVVNCHVEIFEEVVRICESYF